MEIIYKIEVISLNPIVRKVWWVLPLINCFLVFLFFVLSGVFRVPFDECL
jgi:hypothetical protein